MVKKYCGLNFLADGIVYKKDASNGLSYEKMFDKINKKHPRMTERTGNLGLLTYKKRPICSTRTGCFSCRGKDRESDLKEYGTGVVMYFQFLKYLIVVYLLMTLLSLPSIYWFFAANPLTPADLKEFLSLISLGNVGAT
jgi:hypothetical protein